MILHDLYPFYHQFLSHKIVQHQVALVVKNLSANTGEVRGAGLIPGTLQYSCLENPADRGAWKAMIHSVVKSWTWLKQLSSSSDSKKFWNGFSFLCLSYQELNTLYVYVYILMSPQWAILEGTPLQCNNILHIQKQSRPLWNMSHNRKYILLVVSENKHLETRCGSLLWSVKLVLK